MYAVLMIDLKNSREYDYETRNIIQHSIIECCYVLNKVFERNILRHVEFSAGDEVQGLFCSPEAAYLYYRWFIMMLDPVKVRAGIGVGSWDIQIEEKGTTAQDGKVYHNARKALKEADENDGYPILFFSDTELDPVVNSLISASAFMMDKMSDFQKDLMLLTELYAPIGLDDDFMNGDIAKLCELIHYVRNKQVDGYERNILRKGISGQVWKKVKSEMVTPIKFLNEKSFYIKNGRQRGVPSKLADVLGVSRQSVEKTMKVANINGARNLVIAILRSMKYCVGK